MVSLINNFCSLQKRLKRQKALLQSISIPTEEKSRFKDCLSVEYMSSEHSVPEDNLDQENSSQDENFPRKRVLCRRPLPWRSQELNNLFLKLDRKANWKQSQRSSSMTIDRRDRSPERERHQMMPLNLLFRKDILILGPTTVTTVMLRCFETLTASHIS